jgi:NADPH2:quinone reductase
VPVSDQVLVEVAGAGVNRADLVQRAGRYPAPPGAPPDVPGLEFSGTVAAVGPAVRSLETGARVFGILGGGGQASHVVVAEPHCCRVPRELDLVEAGGVPEVFVTAHDALFGQAQLQAGERVLIHGVGSGVGTAAVQLAHVAGAWTVGTSRTSQKLERARRLGLDDAVAAGEDMAERIGDIDVVLDLVGGDYLDVDLRVCRTGGCVIIVGLLAGARAEIDLGRLMSARLCLRGTSLRTRPDHEKARAVASFCARVVPLFARARLRPVIEEIVPLERAADAYERLKSGDTFGKIVLAPGG